MKYRVHPAPLAVCRLHAQLRVPEWATEGGFFCVVRTPDELSVVCEEACVPTGILVEKGWVALQLQGPFPFSMTGVLASFVQPLAEAGISVFAVSTFDTDYVLIQRGSLEPAVKALAAAGHEMVTE